MKRHIGAKAAAEAKGRKAERKGGKLSETADGN